MTTDYTNLGKSGAQRASEEKRSQVDHDAIIAQIRERGNFVELDEIHKDYSTQDDGILIGADDRAHKVIRGQRNLERIPDHLERRTILDGSRIIGWLVEVSADEFESAAASATRAELAARIFEQQRAATTKALKSAKREIVIPGPMDNRGKSHGDCNPGSVERVRQVIEEHLLEVKGTDPALVYAPAVKLKDDAEECFGAVGLRRIGNMAGAAQIVYSEISTLGRAWGSKCDLPKCSGDAESIRFGVVLCEGHLS